MTWTAVVESSTGRLVSVGSVVGDVPAGLVTVQLTAQPDQATEVWDPAKRKFVARPAEVLVDRLDDLQNDGGLVGAGIWLTLTPLQRTALRNRLIALLGPRRWRRAVEPVDLDV